MVQYEVLKVLIQRQFPHVEAASDLAFQYVVMVFWLMHYHKLESFHPKLEDFLISLLKCLAVRQCFC